MLGVPKSQGWRLRASGVDGLDCQEDEAGLESADDDWLDSGDAGEAPISDFTLSLLLLEPIGLLASWSWLCLSRIHATGGRRSSALSRGFKDTGHPWYCMMECACVL